MTKKKFDIRNILLMLFSSALTIFLLEIALRVLFASDQTFLVKDYQDKSFRTGNKYWKTWHYPGSRTEHIKDCFEAVYTTNEYGMRSPIIKKTSKYKIALLGDSFLEGYSASDNENFAHLLDSLTGKEVEILNFGTSGGFGTIHELIQYENFVRHFKPDLVILFYLNYNDVHDNMKAINEGFLSKELDFTYQTDGFEEVVAHIRSFKQPDAVNKMYSSSYAFSLALKGYNAFSTFTQSALNMKFDFRTHLANVYSANDSLEVKQGYDIARKSLKKLKELIQQDSSELLVVNLPDPFQLDANWLKASETKFGKTLTPELPNTIIKEICQTAKIDYHDMYPEANNFIRKNKVEFPYFSNICDRHPSKFGNEYLASEIFKLLHLRNNTIQ